MEWTWGLLTTADAERCLRRAGLDPDVAGWSTSDCEKAEEVLAAEVARKRNKLMGRD